MSTLVLTALLAAALLGGPVDTLDAPPPTTAREGFLPLGTVRIHPGRGEVEVDGFFNLRGGFIEFLACSPGVKRHESLVSLDCDPVDLNAAILLLGIEPGTPPAGENDLRPIEGPRVVIRLRYEFTHDDGTRVLRDIRAEDAIINGPQEQEMVRCGFVYTGSQFIEDLEVEVAEGETPPEVFAPRVLGQLIALSHRPYAILDNPLALPYRDGDYYAYPAVLPLLDREKDTPVTLVIRLPRTGEIDRKVTRMELPPREPDVSDNSDNSDDEPRETIAPAGGTVGDDDGKEVPKEAQPDEPQ